MKNRISLWTARLGVLLVGGLLLFGLSGLLDLEISSGDAGLWVPEGSKERGVLDDFNRQFGAEDLLLISWDGCEISDARLGELARRIRDKDQLHSESTGSPKYFHSIRTYQDFQTELASPFLDENRLRESLRGFFVGRDSPQGVVILESTDYGAVKRADAFALAERESVAFLGESERIRFGGPCFVSICANQETKESLLIITPIVAAISLLMGLLLLRNWAMAIFAFTASGVAALLGLIAIHLGGKEFGNMLTVVPSLCQLLAMSNAVHLLNYYKDHYQKTQDSASSLREAFRVGWLPTVAATVTTVIGVAALGSANLAVAKDFALYGAIGVCGSAVSILILIPLFLTAFPPKPSRTQVEIKVVDFLNVLTERFKWIISLGSLAALAFAGYGLTRLSSDVRIENFFPERSTFGQDYVWFREHFAAPQFADLVVEFPKSTEIKTQIDFVSALAEEAGKIDDEHAVFSPAIFALSLPPDAPNSAFESLWAPIEQAGLAVLEEDHYHWRISIRYQPAPNPEESTFEQSVDEAIAAARSRTSSLDSPEVILIGAYQLFAGAQNSLMSQLLKTFLLAFLFITPVVMLMLRSWKLGLIAILGNLFPLVIFFGSLGWLGYRIDIATMMIAAVAFGIAVDDTMHYLTWLGRGKRIHGTLSGAVPFAYQHCAIAIGQTTLIISIGMLAFLLCDFRPSVKFATFSSLVLVLAFVGDLIFLPALIRLFASSRSQSV